MCYSIYHPLDSESALSGAGVIIERAHDGRCRKRRGSVLLKGVRGIFPEIFEKSIDKHKIDAILNAPSFSERSFARLF